MSKQEIILTFLRDEDAEKEINTRGLQAILDTSRTETFDAFGGNPPEGKELCVLASGVKDGHIFVMGCLVKSKTSFATHHMLLTAPRPEDEDARETVFTLMDGYMEKLAEGRAPKTFKITVDDHPTKRSP